MSEYSRSIVAGIVTVVVIAAFVAVELNNAYSPASSSNSSLSQSAISTQSSSSASSTNSTIGLQLKLILNSTSIKTGGAITAQIEVLNTLDHNLTLAFGPTWNQTIPALNGTMYSLNNNDYVCSLNPDYYFANFVVFKGHYSAENISSAGSPLPERYPFYPPCAGPANTPVPVTFLPKGDEVAASQPGYIPLNVTAEVSATTLHCPGSGNGGEINCGYGQGGLVGYWNSSADTSGGDDSFASRAFTYFPTGEYTIVAFDAWNQYAYATFVVQP